MLSLNTPADALQALAASIKSARLQADITRQELAERSGVGVATLARVEKNGICSTETLVRILAALGVVDRLVDVLSLPEPTTIAGLRESGQKPQRLRARSKP
jgi:transcriptional regulator with XRE-family HTH domain